jgi:hypothetical protein
MMPEPDPKPRSEPKPYAGAVWPVHRSIRVQETIPPNPADFSSILEGRRSERVLLRAPLRETLNFVSYATAPRQSWGSQPARSRRPAHSAGALHPIEPIVVAGKTPRILRPRPSALLVDVLTASLPEAALRLLIKVREMLPQSKCDLIVLIADRARIDAHYENADQLIMRDAGALMQTLHFCAAAMRLGFCPLGISGRDLVDALFEQNCSMAGVGVAAVGRVAG